MCGSRPLRERLNMILAEALEKLFYDGRMIKEGESFYFNDQAPVIDRKTNKPRTFWHCGHCDKEFKDKKSAMACHKKDPRPGRAMLQKLGRCMRPIADAPGIIVATEKEAGKKPYQKDVVGKEAIIAAAVAGKKTKASVTVEPTVPEGEQVAK